MALTNKVSKICTVLDAYFPCPPVPLNHNSPFSFLVAVVLSAQTTDGKVNAVTAELFKHGPTPEKMAGLDPKFVEDIIRPLGLANRKAENVVKLSSQLFSRFSNTVPSSFDDLESLAGVGRKTASVIRSQLFGIPSFAVDTHIHRLALRWGITKEEKNVNKAQEDLCKVFPEEKWNDLHLQMIYFGREFCTAKDHKDSECPMCSWVHKKDGHLIELDKSRFQSKKKVKGIVYYADRMEELRQAPEIALYSSSPTRAERQNSSNTVAVPSIREDLIAEESKEISATATAAATAARGRKKRKVSDL